MHVYRLSGHGLEVSFVTEVIALRHCVRDLDDKGYDLQLLSYDLPMMSINFSIVSWRAPVAPLDDCTQFFC